jgi:hypothetical protein
MAFLIELIVGDASRDGNGQTEVIIVSSNKSSSEIMKAYRKGVQIVGVDLEDEVSTYSNTELTSDFVEAISKHFDLNDYAEEYEGEWNIYPGGYAGLYMDIAKLGDSSIEFEYPSTESIDVGGQGLLSY